MISFVLESMNSSFYNILESVSNLVMLSQAIYMRFGLALLVLGFVYYEPLVHMGVDIGLVEFFQVTRSQLSPDEFKEPFIWALFLVYIYYRLIY